jgi:hypothetical protein
MTNDMNRIAADALLDMIDTRDRVITFDLPARLQVIAETMMEARNIIGEDSDEVIEIGRSIAKIIASKIEKDIRDANYDGYLPVNLLKIIDDIMTVVGEYLIID